MKLQQIFLLVAIAAILYSCGGNSDNNQDNNTSDKTVINETQQSSEAIVKHKTDSELQKILDTIKSENIHIIKYKGTLGESKISVEFHNPSDEKSYSLYMYDKLHNPLLLGINPKANYICFKELFPTKEKYTYKEGGTLSFKKHKKYEAELTGEYINPKGTKTYPVKLQVTDIIPINTKGNFEVLQEYSTKKHYFAILVNELHYNSSPSHIIVYDKKTGKKIQSLPFNMFNYGGDYDTHNCIRPTNTKPNGIQIAYTPITGNDNRDDDNEAFIYKNGKYEKDTLLSNIGTDYGHIYKGYNENGDISVIKRYDRFSHYYTIPVTSGVEAHYQYVMDNTNYYYDVELKEIYDKNCQCIVRTIKNASGKYKRVSKLDAKNKEYVLSDEVTTNYSEADYKISSDGKTLLKYNVRYGIFDMNGQDDLRAVEKISDTAFDIESNDPDDPDSESDMSNEEPHESFRIILNKNFNSIPKAIQKYPNLAKITELVVANPQQSSSSTDLYKYFSKNEISKKMEYALKLVKRAKAKIDKKEDKRIVLDELFKKLIEKDGYTSPSNVEKKWGKADDKSVEKNRYPCGEDCYYTKTTVSLKFNQADIALTNMGGDWFLSSFSTTTGGFGFAGIYVGIPECNKEYLLKLFKNNEVNSFKEGNDEYLEIEFLGYLMYNFKIQLDSRGLVKSISYSAYSVAG